MLLCSKAKVSGRTSCGLTREAGDALLLGVKISELHQLEPSRARPRWI